MPHSYRLVTLKFRYIYHQKYVRIITLIIVNRIYSEVMYISKQAVYPIRKTDDESIVAHFSGGTSMKFAKNEAIIHINEEPQGVYLIKSGFVKAYSISRTGSESLLIIHQTGDFIPLPWALNGTYTSDLCYEAMTDVSVLRVSKESLRKSMGDNPWLAQQIMSQAVSMIGLYTQRIKTLEYKSARGRIISEFIHMAKRFGENQKGDVLINAPLTQQDIADSINVTRETASRAIELLTDERLLSHDNHLYTMNGLNNMYEALDAA